MRDATRKEIIWGLTAALVVWGFYLFFANAYFAAPAFGVPIPTWAAWVGALPWWSFNVIDTFAVVAIVALVLLELKRRGRKHRLGSRGAGTVGAIVGWAIVLVALALFAFLVFHLTLPAIIQDLKGFLGIG